MNIMVGFVVLAWILAPTAYYSNLWGSKAMPIVSNRVFTADGYFYNVSAVLTPQLRLNETAYRNYGRPTDRVSHEIMSDRVSRSRTNDGGVRLFICHLLCSHRRSDRSYYSLSR